ncbi:hypothetical protein [Bacillus halotolerans]|uniref:hypothetical protein n=1 Tax=Bacillus halotolerans TaxID=260554 RepID=UPI00404AF3B7
MELMDLNVDYSLYNTIFAIPEEKTLIIPVPDDVEDEKVSQHLKRLVVDLKWEVISFEYTGFKLMRNNGEYALVEVESR